MADVNRTKKAGKGSSAIPNMPKAYSATFQPITAPAIKKAPLNMVLISQAPTTPSIRGSNQIQKSSKAKYTTKKLAIETPPTNPSIPKTSLTDLFPLNKSIKPKTTCMIIKMIDTGNSM